MQGEWLEIAVPNWFSQTEKDCTAKAYFRDRVFKEINYYTDTPMQLTSMADFVYVPKTNSILKSRHDSIEMLFESAERYMGLRHHPNEHVRKLIEKAETLAALTEHTY